MTITSFIEKATEGGYARYDRELGWGNGNNVECFYDLILDPLAWQAVGKVEGWFEMKIYKCPKKCKVESYTENWHCPKCGTIMIFENTKPVTANKNMHRMIDTLCEGKSLEEFIATL